jgi:hypothetical protein
MVLLAGSLYLGGVYEVFRTRVASGRLRGVAAMALGGLFLTAAVGPSRGAPLVVAAVSGLTLAGLLLVARAMELTASREDGSELRLDVDPLRWR